MEATVVKLKGCLQNSKIMMGGLMVLNPFKISYSLVFSVFTREANIPNNSRKIILKSYDGSIGSSSGEFTIKGVETVAGAVIRTYEVPLTSGSHEYSDENGNTYIGRQVRLQPLSGGASYSAGVPWRIDIIGDDLDFLQGGTTTDGYANPMTIDADQIKYSTIPYIGKLLVVTRCNGAIKTEWFKNNPNLIRLDVKGSYAKVQGNIMDLVGCGNTLELFNFTLQVGIKGIMSEFLNALRDSGVKNHTMEPHITESGIINDVYPGPDGDYTYNVFKVVFDSNGNWTAIDR